MREDNEINGVTYDNMSVDSKVGFVEEGHKYEFVDDKDFKFTSVTTVLKDYYPPFDTVGIATKKSKDKKSEYFGISPKDIMYGWEEFAAIKSGEGTILHEYGEDLFNGKDVDPPKLPKAKWVPEIIEKIFADGYELAKTELLVYSKQLNLAGQSDIILKKEFEDEFFYMIYDWKFLSKPLERKSFYNRFLRKYAMMTGPFKHLMDCNWIHYSIQLAIYQTLTGDAPKVREKVLVVVYDNGYELVPTYPMRVFWDDNMELQAVYELWNGKFYDSRTDSFTNKWPSDIKGR